MMKAEQTCLPTQTLPSGSFGFNMNRRTFAKLQYAQ